MINKILNDNDIRSIAIISIGDDNSKNLEHLLEVNVDVKSFDLCYLHSIDELYEIINILYVNDYIGMVIISMNGINECNYSLNNLLENIKFKNYFGNEEYISVY